MKYSSTPHKEDRLLHEQVKLLYNAIPNSMLAICFGSLVALVIFSGAVETLKLATWIGALLGVTLLRCVDLFRYRPQRDDITRASYWYYRFKIGSTLIALAVGSGGWLLFVADNGSFQVTLALMLVCIASFAITTLSPRRNILLSFLLITFIPILVTQFLSDTEISRYLFWMMCLLLILLLVSGSRISATITHNIELALEATEREDALRRSRQRLSLYLQETPMAVIDWNTDFEVLEWNPGAENIFGYKASEAIGKKAFPLIINEGSRDQVIKVWLQLLKNEGGRHSIHENHRKDGSVILCEWFNTPLIDQSGKVIGVTSLAQDVTRRVENEKLKNEFVSIVSHELRTPLTSIKGTLGMLSNGLFADDPQKTKEMLDIALHNANRLHLLLNDILDVEKLESDKVHYWFEDCDLTLLIREVMKLNQSYLTQQGVTIKAELEEHSMVRIDSIRIHQVLANLLSNAIKYSAEGGTVTIRTVREDKQLRILVSNFGEVIPEKDRKHIFSKFFQSGSANVRTREGSGLGLYICQKILSQHDTHLDFTSSAEAGTTFFFTLPLA